MEMVESPPPKAPDSAGQYEEDENAVVDASVLEFAFANAEIAQRIIFFPKVESSSSSPILSRKKKGTRSVLS